MSKIEPGCLAVICRLESLNYGKVVTVVEPYDGRVSETGRPFEPVDGFTWIVEAGNLVFEGGGRGNCLRGYATSWSAARETSLRRIDNPGDDEADLLLAPLPQQIKETA